MLSQVVFVAGSLPAGPQCPFSADIHALVQYPRNTHAVCQACVTARIWQSDGTPLLRVGSKKATRLLPCSLLDCLLWKI